MLDETWLVSQDNVLAYRGERSLLILGVWRTALPIPMKLGRIVSSHKK